MEADGLSTAIYVGGEDAGKKLLAHYRGASATITRLDGAIVAL
jgi:thiamine biosynthesis lipoprotein ApbE